MKKVLFILQWPPPVHGSSMVGSYIKNSKLINKEFIADYVNLSTSKKIDEIGKYGFYKLITFLKIILRILYKNITIKYDLVYMAISINGKAVYKDAFLILLLKLFKRKIVFHLHNKGASQYQSKIRKKIYKFVFRDSDVILLSDYLYDDIKDYVKRENVQICFNGIPDSVKSPIKRNYNNKRSLNFLFLSNMIESKGVYILLEACSVLRKKGKEFKCHFVGAWKDIKEEEFYEMTRILEIEDLVLYHGSRYGDEKNEFWKLADIFVFPTFYKQECFPLVLIEAMQYSLPIVSTFEGGIPDIVEDNKTGFLCEQKDVFCLAEKLEIFLNNPDLCEAFGKSARILYESNLKLEVFENNLINILNLIAACS